MRERAWLWAARASSNQHLLRFINTLSVLGMAQCTLPRQWHYLTPGNLKTLGCAAIQHASLAVQSACGLRAVVGGSPPAPCGTKGGLIDRQSHLEGFQHQGHRGRCDSGPPDTPGDVCAEASLWRTVPCSLGTSWLKPLCSPSKTYFLKGEEVA